jgi:hypothetical protein
MHAVYALELIKALEQEMGLQPLRDDSKKMHDEAVQELQKIEEDGEWGK